jgi:hypothetical protein
MRTLVGEISRPYPEFAGLKAEYPGGMNRGVKTAPLLALLPRFII